MNDETLLRLLALAKNGPHPSTSMRALNPYFLDHCSLKHLFELHSIAATDALTLSSDKT
jgi:hypothetical protein